MKSEYFTFDGKKSLEMGYYHVRVGGGDAKVELTGSRSVDMKKFGTKMEHYIHGIKKEPLKFTIQVIPIEERQWTNEMYSNVCEWLIKDEFKEFISEDNPSKVYYAIATGHTEWNGVFKLGHIEFEFETNSNTAWSLPEYSKFKINGTKVIEVENISNVGNKRHSPIIEIKKLGNAGDISIKNLSNGAIETKLTGLNDGETFTMDNKYRLFIADTPTNYYGLHFNKQWLELVGGVNKLEVSGDCELTFKCQYPII